MAVAQPDIDNFALPVIARIACFSIPPLPILPIFFIVSAIWRCIFRRRFSSATLKHQPAAMRFLRLACF